jgi:hypothetical protein
MMTQDWTGTAFELSSKNREKKASNGKKKAREERRVNERNKVASTSSNPSSCGVAVRR